MNDDNNKLSENLEDYLEMISSLSAYGGSARTTDIADALNVKKPSVTAALNVLSQKGLIEYERYKPVVLTESGKKLANKVMRKHRLLSNFFTDVLGVDPKQADEAACKMEHALEDSIMKRLFYFLNKMSAKICSECKFNATECEKKCPSLIALDKLEKGDKGLIVFVEKDLETESSKKQGIAPNCAVVILDKSKDGKSARIKTIAGEFSVSKDVLNAVKVKVI